MGTVTKAKVGKTVVVRSKDKPAAASKRKLTEAEIEALEDAEDIRDAEKALKAGGGVPIEDLWKELGL